MKPGEIKLETIPSDSSSAFNIRATYRPDWDLINGASEIFKRYIEEGKIIIAKSQNDS